MASRQEEKEKRRQERLAAEQAEAARAARSKRLRLATGAVLAAALVAAVVIAIVASSGDDKKTTVTHPSAKLPAQKITDLSAAAKAAGCVVKDYPASAADRGHTDAKVTYKTNPPAFGPHNPTPASDGDYSTNGAPPKEKAVHALEHGRIEYQYRPGLPKAQVDQLRALFSEQDGSLTPGQYLLLFPNQTKMPYDVAAVAWTHILSCAHFNPKVFDAMRAFRVKYTLKGPEFINAPE